VGNRRGGRELALQALYALDVNPGEASSSLRLLRENLRAPGAAIQFAEELVAGVAEHRAVIDQRIETCSKNWTLSRMARVDLNILRMAVYELLFCPGIPKNVTINEAIEVARKFGTGDSPAFVNGILDEIAAPLPEK
jgi:N utilization substance protein B